MTYREPSDEARSEGATEVHYLPGEMEVWRTEDGVWRLFDRLSKLEPETITEDAARKLFAKSHGLTRSTCEGCDDCVFPGVRWPTATNGDDSRQWIERCDTCCLYESDQHAADELVKMIRVPVGQAIEYGAVTPGGMESPTPYLTVYP